MARSTISFLKVLLLTLCFTMRSGETLITSTYRDLNGDGLTDRISLILTSGRWLDDSEELWSGAGKKFEGRFALEVKFAGHKAVRTDLGRLFYPDSPDEEMWFYAGPWELKLGDFNRDGQPDFTIGQHGGSNTWYYKLFTVRPSGVVQTLPVLGELHGVANGHDGASTAFEGYEEDAKYGFIAGFYDNRYGTGVSRCYVWDVTRSGFICISQQVGNASWKPVGPPAHE